MKNSIKFFLGGVVASAMVFGALAFTQKQVEGNGYLIIRTIEFDSGYMNKFKSQTQICKEDGTIELLENLERGQNFGIDREGKNTATITNLLNKYYKEGYKIKSYTTSSSGNVSMIINTIVLEK